MRTRLARAGLLLALAVLAVLAAAAAPGAVEPPAPPVNAMHPPIPLRDERGEPLGAGAVAFSTERSCGDCHDSAFIREHSAHDRRGVQIDCLTCHLAGGKAAVLALPRDAEGRVTLPMAPPASRSCGQCHGLVHEASEYLELADTLLRGAMPGSLAQTLRTGEIFSGQAVAASLLNLQGKSGLSRPWDIHAARGLGCADCHYAANNPKRALLAKDGLAHLKQDPRSLTIAAFLKQPDHTLAAAACTDCHDATLTHQSLPYAERHLRALACQTCHSPRLLAPALRAVDYTVVTAEDGPRLEFRGVAAAEFRAPSTWYLTGYRPLLARVEQAGRRVYAPYNVVSRWEWVAADGNAVPAPTLQRAFKDEQGAYHPELLAALDRDGDGRLADSELRLAGSAEAIVRGRLVALGVAAPRIRGEIDAYPVRHGTVRGDWTAASCASCHAQASRFNEALALGSAPFPGGVLPVPTAQTASLLDGRRVEVIAEGLAIVGGGASADTYVLGHDRRPWSDALGLALFAATGLGVLVHGLLRYRGARRRGALPPPPAGPREYLYGLYERIWHWTMAASILLLLASGLAIHYPQGFRLLSFPVAVLVHNVMAWVLILNAGLSLFYHVTTGEIRQFLPQPAGLPRRILAQALYYTRGIFAGAAHPTVKSRERKLNALQQVTYAGLLNVLFPLQVVTGILLWVEGLAPARLEPALGLALVAPLHNLGFWLFLSFLVVHVYLTTTGRTLSTNVKAMVSGWETLDAHGPAPAPSQRAPEVEA